MSRKIRTERKIEDYSRISDLEHVYMRTDTYAGSASKRKHNNLIYDNGKLVEREIKTPEAVQRAFLEIMSNAGDNCDASRRAKVEPGKIEVTADQKVIKIKNYGLSLDVQKVVLETEGSKTNVREYTEEDGENYMWLPAYIFGYLRTSNNYDDENVVRSGSGRNGFGSKITNIFSKHYKVIVQDTNSKRRFTGIWKDNMFKDNLEKKPEIEIVEDDDINTAFVSIEWVLDFERFKMKQYSVEDLALFARFTVDFSFSCKIITVFNGVEMDYRNIYDFAKLFFEEEVIEKSVIKYHWDKVPDELVKNSDTVLTKKISEAKKAEYIPQLEVLILDTPDNSRIVSYVNSLMTIEGGVHVEAVFNQVVNYLKTIVKGIFPSKIKPHLSMIVNARLLDTEYNSQSKTKLVSPEPNFFLEENKLKKLNNWDIIERLRAEIDAMAFKSATKSDGKKAKHILTEKGFNANKAGTKDSSKCALYVVEGDSASQYPKDRIDLLENGKDYNGLAILRGKPLNITNAPEEKYIDNKVFSYIKQMLGLKEGLDYNSKKNRDTLRYGFIIINVDADDDGYHILSHFLNFLKEKFPGILKQNMVGYLRTPVIKLRKNSKIFKRFFTNKEFSDWNQKNDTKGYDVRYYKGLGSSEKEDTKDDLKHAPTIYCIYDDKSDEGFELAFNKRNADQRKEWISKWRDVSQVEDIISVDLKEIIRDKNPLEGAQNISQFLNRELVNYGVTSLFRSIPSEYDHLKVSQRKALYGALCHFNYNPVDQSKRMNVGRLVNKTAEMVQYHHGETSLAGTFIKMAQDFPGSNNMGYFYQGGAFGTRGDGGKGAANPRYIKTHLTWWIPHVYYKESVELIPKHTIENEECEPFWLPGVIPMNIVNGTHGIATGFATSSPPHHPIEVVEWYEKRCKGETSEPLLPWYNKFTGKREIVNRINNFKPENELPLKIDALNELEQDFEETENEELEMTENDNMAYMKHAAESKLSIKTYGKYTLEKGKGDSYIINITELPVGCWTEDYVRWLNSIVVEKNKEKSILDFDDNSTSEKINITIKWNKNHPVDPSMKTLKLIKSFGLSNMTLIDHRGFPTKYESIQEIMEKYYEHMISHYKDVINYRIKNEENVVINCDYMMKFIVSVLKDKIKIRKVKEDFIKEQMENLEIPFKYYEKSKLRDFSEESLEKYQKQIDIAKERLEMAKKTKPEDIWLERLAKLKTEILKRKKGKFFNFSK